MFNPLRKVYFTVEYRDMENDLKNLARPAQTRFSFGATSAIITNLGIITGLDTLAHPKLSIIGALLVIALADNLSDSFGIHIYQESEHISKKEVWLSTLTNFLARLFVSSTFIALIIFLPVKFAAVCSVVWGLLILIIMTYIITRQRKMNPYTAILAHTIVAILVVAAGHFIGAFLVARFQG
jgi:VIT1/CCC1 family predicted Fe2+/Mn2+ transporter